MPMMFASPPGCQNSIILLVSWVLALLKYSRTSSATGTWDRAFEGTTRSYARQTG
jgi:hypothetical protein